MAQAKQDMGTGSIKKLMLQLMIPAVVAQVVNLLYNICLLYTSLGCNPNPCEHHGTVMAAHSCGVLKEHFAKMRSLHRHEAEPVSYTHLI